MKVRIEYEVEMDDPEETEEAWRRLAKSLTPKKWSIKEVQFCTRLEQRGATTFQNVRVIRVVAGEAPP